MTTADVVVVGAGGAGAPLAARLSEDPGRRVVLLEAGPAPTRITDFPPELLDPTTVQGAMPAHPNNWAHPAHLTPDRPFAISRGRILGGSTALNGASFVPAPDTDFERWAAAGGPEWMPEAVRAAQERILIPRLRAPETALTRAFHEAAAELGAAAEPVPLSIRDGLRWNTALAYLLPAQHRGNLEIRGEAQVARVLVDGGRAVGVELRDGDRVPAREVVLAAGAIGSPHLLLLSGVGPRADLDALGIPVVADLPVGVAFADHPDLAVGWRSRVPVEREDDPAAFPMRLALPDLEVLLGVKNLRHLLTGTMDPGSGVPADLQLVVSLQRPVGRGRIALESADPGVGPRIEYRYLEEPADRERLRHGIRFAVALLRSDAFAALFDRLTELDDDVLGDDDALDRWMRTHLGTAIHACASVPMGPVGSPHAVVDGFGRVHGVPGLRVADTSILPDTPSVGPAATAVLIGERIAEFVARGD